MEGGGEEERRRGGRRRGEERRERKGGDNNQHCAYVEGILGYLPGGSLLVTVISVSE